MYVQVILRLHLPLADFSARNLALGMARAQLSRQFLYGDVQDRQFCLKMQVQWRALSGYLTNGF